MVWHSVHVVGQRFKINKLLIKYYFVLVLPGLINHGRMTFIFRCDRPEKAESE